MFNLCVVVVARSHTETDTQGQREFKSGSVDSRGGPQLMEFSSKMRIISGKDFEVDIDVEVGDKWW